MKVLVQLKHTSLALSFEKVFNAYEKGSFYVVMLPDGLDDVGNPIYKYEKFPIMDIFRVIEQ